MYGAWLKPGCRADPDHCPGTVAAPARRRHPAAPARPDPPAALVGLAMPPPAPRPPSPPTLERLRGDTMITTNYSCRNLATQPARHAVRRHIQLSPTLLPLTLAPRFYTIRRRPSPALTFPAPEKCRTLQVRGTAGYALHCTKFACPLINLEADGRGPGRGALIPPRHSPRRGNPAAPDGWPESQPGRVHVIPPGPRLAEAVRSRG